MLSMSLPTHRYSDFSTRIFLEDNLSNYTKVNKIKISIFALPRILQYRTGNRKYRQLLKLQCNTPSGALSLAARAPTAASLCSAFLGL